MSTKCEVWNWQLTDYAILCHILAVNKGLVWGSVYITGHNPSTLQYKIKMFYGQFSTQSAWVSSVPLKRTCMKK